MILLGLGMLAAGILLNCLAVLLPARIHYQDAVWLADADKQEEPLHSTWRELLGSYRLPNYLVLLLLFSPAANWIVATAFLGPGEKSAIISIFLSGLCVLAVIDSQTHLLPDALTLPLTGLGLLIQFFPLYRTVGLENAVLGLLFAYAILGGLAFVANAVGRPHSLGEGDIKLSALIGSWCGPLICLGALFLGTLFAFLFNGIAALLGQRTWQAEFPLGPWLVAACYLILLVFIR